MLRPVLQFPDARLKTVSEPVENIDDSVRELAQDIGLEHYQRLLTKEVRVVKTNCERLGGGQRKFQRILSE